MCTIHNKKKQKKTKKSAKKMILPLLVKFFAFIRIYVDRFIDYIFGCYYKSQLQYLPKPTNLLILESGISLAKRIREKKITSLEVVESYIKQIKQVNFVINAVVDNCFDAAIEEAKIIDDNIKNHKFTAADFDAKPFLGVPFTTKETTSCKGLRHTFGLLCREDKIGEEDADVTKLLKNAGGILLGVTNVPQLNMWQETDNPVYGRTKNPYNSTRNVGGSSGGEAAIIAACGSPIGIGTDIGGSIRMPAFMCGVYGHKPTTGLMSTKGLTYRTGKELSTMVCVGPLTKSCDDITPLLKVLLDKNVNKLKLDEKVNVNNLEIFYMLECGDARISSISREMKNTILRVVKHFELNCKAVPQKLDLPGMKYGGELWRYWMTQEKSNFARDLTDRTGQVSWPIEILKFIIGRSEFNIGTMFNLINTVLPVKDSKWSQDLTKELTEKLTSMLSDNAVLLYPSAPFTARYHNSALLRPWNFWYFTIWNALKFPVLQVPLGLDSEGLPIGIQIVAAPFQDHLCIAVAKELEAAFGGYVPPFELNK